MTYIDAATLPYHGVLIERPCSVCDTVDLHFEGRCSQGPCTVCGLSRGGHYQGDGQPHEWLPAQYQPSLISYAPASFDAIVSMARLAGIPAHFRSDLFRDYQALTGTGLWKNSTVPERFIWVIRSTGTDLITADTSDQTAELLVTRNERAFIWWHGHLSEVSHAEALATHSLWRRQKLGLLDPEKFEVG